MDSAALTAQTLLNAAMAAAPFADYELAEISLNYGEPFASIANTLAAMSATGQPLPPDVRTACEAILKGKTDPVSQWAQKTLAQIPRAPALATTAA